MKKTLTKLSKTHRKPSVLGHYTSWSYCLSPRLLKKYIFCSLFWHSFQLLDLPIAAKSYFSGKAEKLISHSLPVCFPSSDAHLHEGWWWTVGTRIPGWALLCHISQDGWEQAPAFHISAAAQMSCALLKGLPSSGSDFALVQGCMNQLSFRCNWGVRCPPEDHLQEMVQLIMGILMEQLRWGRSYSKVTIPCPHTESVMDGVNFFIADSMVGFVP